MRSQKIPPNYVFIILSILKQVISFQTVFLMNLLTHNATGGPGIRDTQGSCVTNFCYTPGFRQTSSADDFCQ